MEVRAIVRGLIRSCRALYSKRISPTRSQSLQVLLAGKHLALKSCPTLYEVVRHWGNEKFQTRLVSRGAKLPLRCISVGRICGGIDGNSVATEKNSVIAMCRGVVFNGEGRS